MNLRCMTNISCKLVLILLVLILFTACGNQSGSESGQTNDQQQIASSSHDDDEHHEDGGDHYDDKHHDGDRPAGPAPDPDPDPGTSGVNVITVHNPKSPQYDDNCLSCHAGIPDSESLDPAIPNAHVAMLGFTPGIGSDQCIWCHRDVSNNLIYTTAQVGAFQANIRKTVDTQLCAICHGPVGPGKPFYQSGLTTAADLNGAELYRHLCSACHKQLSDSEVGGESAEEIYGAIAENEGGMAPLSVLNPAWVQAIAAALGGDTTLPPDIPAPGTGAGDGLYQQYCSNCHGPLANSAKAGATATDIQNGISNVPEMSTLGFLTTTQIQAIADSLAGSGGGTGGGGTGGTDGASLYQTYCSGCHNDLANSNQSGASVTLIQNAINNVGEMSSLSFLTATQIQAIANALAGSGGGTGGGGTGGGGTGGTDGASLYQTYCSGCHNDLANSNQAGASASQIQNGINNVNEMSSLSSLTTTQIQAIADALAGGGGGGTGGGGTGGGTGDTDGASLYQTYCLSCHGALNESEVRNKSAEDIRHAIEENEGDMGTLESLTESQIEAIAAVLN